MLPSHSPLLQVTSCHWSRASCLPLTSSVGCLLYDHPPTWALSTFHTHQAIPIILRRLSIYTATDCLPYRTLSRLPRLESQPLGTLVPRGDGLDKRRGRRCAAHCAGRSSLVIATAKLGANRATKETGAAAAEPIQHPACIERSGVASTIPHCSSRPIQ